MNNPTTTNGTEPTGLVISNLRAAVDGTPILKGVDLTVPAGEVHAVMGPNGSGKSTLSHVIMGRPGYEVTGGSVYLDGIDMLALNPYERAKAGLFLIMQYPTEVPGVRVSDLLEAAYVASGRNPADVYAAINREVAALGIDPDLMDRPVNVDLSGGEKKRNETLQLGVLAPKFALLDELDSGLDVDALAMASARVERATKETNLGVLAITHYPRLLNELKADTIHVFVDGRIVDQGPAQLADEIENSGYDRWVQMTPSEVGVSFGGGGGLGIRGKSAGADDPFADPLA